MLVPAGALAHELSVPGCLFSVFFMSRSAKKVGKKAKRKKKKRTMVENSQEYKLKYWATHSSVRLFGCTAHSFACSGQLASLAPSAALTRSLASPPFFLPKMSRKLLKMVEIGIVLYS